MTKSVLLLALACATVACEKKDAPPRVTSISAAGGGSVAVTVDERGFSPSDVTTSKGAKLSLVFTRTSDNTCAKEVVFPATKEKHELPLNQPVTIAVPTDTARTVKFQCGMGMYTGAVLIQ